MLLTRTPRTKLIVGLGVGLLATALIFGWRAGNLASASEKAATKTVLGQPFELGRQKSATFPAQHLKVTFERVIDDSRCPSDVNCVWSGQATVAVRLETVGRKAKTLGTANLTVQGSSYVTEKSVSKIGPYWVRLVKVAPEKGPRNSPIGVESIILLVQNKAFPAPKNGS